jgi:hypothetical protein
MCAYRSIRSHRNRDRPRYVYGATRSSVAEPMSRVWSKPLLDQKRDLDFRFSAQMSRSTSRGCYPPTPLICGRAVAKLGPVNAGLFSVAVVQIHVGRTRRSQSSCGYRGPASPTKCADRAHAAGAWRVIDGLRRRVMKLGHRRESNEAANRGGVRGGKPWNGLAGQHR